MLRDVFSKEAKYFLPIISALLVAIVACNASLYMFSFFVLIPLFFRVRQIKSFKEQLIMLISYFVISNFIQLTFITEISVQLENEMKIGKGMIYCAVVLLAIYCSLLNIIPMLIFIKVKTGKLIDIFSFSALYILSEWFCENAVPLSFPWIRLGTVLAPFYTFVQSASIFGSLFITFLILIINGLIANAFCSLNSRKLQYGCFMSAAIVFSVNSLFGVSYIALHEFEGNRASCMLLQANIGAVEKWNLSAMDSLSKNYELAVQSIDKENPPSIIVLPETAVNTSLSRNKEALNAVSRFAQNLNATVITGAFYSDEDAEKSYNAMYAINPDGSVEEPYLKKVLVPFGEYIPFEGFVEKIFPSLATLLKNGRGLVSSDEQINVPTIYGDISGMICLESIYSSELREMCADGGDIIAVLVNDAWFGDSYQLETHFRHSVLRAVENGKYLLHCANTGISGIITPNGKVISATKANTQAAIQANVMFIEKNTFYTYFGDVIILPGAFLIVLGFVRIAASLTRKIRNSR